MSVGDEALEGALSIHRSIVDPCGLLLSYWATLLLKVTPLKSYGAVRLERQLPT